MRQSGIPQFTGADDGAESGRRRKLPPKAAISQDARGPAIRCRSILSLNRSGHVAVALFFLASCLLPIVGRSQQTSSALSQSQPEMRTEENHNKPCKVIYLGIVGGTELSNNSHSGVVQIGDLLRGPTYADVCAKTFSPYFWRPGFHWILKYFPSHPGRLTSDELERAPKVIMVGHSFGGWGVLSVARNLNRKGIPVELCVQIDSVGVTDHTVPRNVKAAAIFHANDAMFLLTTKTMRLEDPSQTKLVDDILVKRAGHWSITRDPRIKDLVLCTVETLNSAPGHAPNCPSEADPKRSLLSSNPHPFTSSQ
jgi:hypothetical protein